MPTIRLSLLSLLLVACSPGANAGSSGVPGRPDTTTRSQRLISADTWGYQLTGYGGALLRPVQASSFDLVVVDAGDDDGTPWTPAQLRAAATRPAGEAARLMIGYLSIGAAKDYRRYWETRWTSTPPPWLLQEGSHWPGSDNVEYWTPEWKAITLRQLDLIIDSGFDGVYLDLVDAYQRNPQRVTARADMVHWVCQVAAHAKKHDPHFLIIPQNASSLIRDPGYAPCVDALGNEETLVYAMNQPTEAARRRELLADYTLWRALGKPVFTIDYADQEPLITQTYARARAASLVPYVTIRNVNVLTPGR